MTVNMTFVIEPTDKKFESHHCTYVHTNIVYTVYIQTTCMRKYSYWYLRQIREYATILYSVSGLVWTSGGAQSPVLVKSSAESEVLVLYVYLLSTNSENKDCLLCFICKKYAAYWVSELWKDIHCFSVQMCFHLFVFAEFLVINREPLWTLWSEKLSLGFNVVS